MSINSWFSRVPLWLKIFLAIAILSLVFTLLEPIVYFSAFLFFIILILFPGKDLENPRLFKIFPWILGITFLASGFILIMQYRGVDLFAGRPAGKPTLEELWVSIISAPLLFLSFIKRAKAFKPLLIITAIASIGVGVLKFGEANQNWNDILELSGDVVTEAALVVYFLRKF